VDRDLLHSTAALYDAVASEYAERVGTALSPNFETSFDRAILASTAERLGSRRAPTLDLGCGPGRVAAYLSGVGINVIGMDLSQGMLASARSAHQGIRFVQGSLGNIPVRSHSVAGVVCWYSIIHTSPHDLPEVFSEIYRACRTDAEVLIAFQAGEGERVDRPNAYASGMTMTSYRHSLIHVADALTSSGLHVATQVTREPDLDHETTPQAFVIARSTPQR
jgi:ubiquinone/menaquinone biosynthesis C-methylase UbiE